MTPNCRFFVQALAAAVALGSIAAPVLGETGRADGDRLAGDVPRVETRISVDGSLDEAAWSKALVVEIPFEVDPEENTPAPVRTECLLAYGPQALYVGFRAYDSEPRLIRSHLIDRDRAWRDDLVGLVIDPFNDERRGFLFMANPAGVQMDAAVSEVGGSGGGRGLPPVAGLPGEDASWDAIWSSAGKITNDGYQVEMSIPYTSLRFQRTSGMQTWGFAAIRAYPRNVRRRLFTIPLERGANCFFCQVDKIRGFEGADPGKNLELVPTLTGLRNQQLNEAGTDLASATTEEDAGLSARWGITPNLNLNAALNPDFSQVEADSAQLDVNTRFALFFPEKRPFFLEGADFFGTPIRAVFTRSVLDPDWGLKFSGKEGGHAFGTFVTRDHAPEPGRVNLILPGNQQSGSATVNEELTTTVGRYRRDIGSSSTLGVLYAGREGGDYRNRLFGVDGVLRFTSSDSLTFQLLRSDTRYPDSLALDEDQPTGSFDDDGVYGRYAHDTRNWSAWAAYQDLGRDFRADTGFVPRVDTRTRSAGAEYRFWGSAGDPYTRISVGLGASRTHDHDGILTDENINVNGRYDGPLQSFLNWTLARKKERFNEVTYEQDTQSFFFNIRPTGDFTSSIRGDFGDVIDFANSRPARRVRVEPGITWDKGHVNLQFDHTFERLTVGGDELFTANLSQLRLVYNFNVRTFIRGIFQNLDLDRNLARYTCLMDPVDPCDPAREEHTQFGQFLFSYKVNPKTVIFAGYSEEQLEESGAGLEPTNRTIFVKLGYAWVM